MRRAIRLSECSFCALRAPFAFGGSGSLHHAKRGYYWPYNEDFVPAGAATSRFQASNVPSVRERIVQEYALGPLFGAATPCCVLGFRNLSPRQVLERKPALHAVLSAFLGGDAGQVRLGPVRACKEMLLYRGGTAESPRVADGLGARPDAAARRVDQYARQAPRATVLVEVFLPDDVAEEDALAQGRLLQERFFFFDEDADDFDSAAAVAAAPGRGERLMDGPLGEAEALYLDCIADLRELGVVYCEVPRPDVSDFVFDKLHGDDVGADAAVEVLSRWERRLAAQSPGREEPPLPTTTTAATAAASRPPVLEGGAVGG